MPNHAKTLDILLTLPLAETSASNSLKSKDTKLLCVGKIFANLQVRSTRTVRVGSDRRAFLVHWQYFLIGIRGNILSDAPLLRCLCRRAAASSARSSASALRDGGPCAASGSSVMVSIVLFAPIIAAVGGGGLSLALRLQSLLDISAASPLLGADGSIASPRCRAWKQPSTCLLPVAPHARRTTRQPLRRRLTTALPDPERRSTSACCASKGIRGALGRRQIAPGRLPRMPRRAPAGLRASCPRPGPSMTRIFERRKCQFHQAAREGDQATSAHGQ